MWFTYTTPRINEARVNPANCYVKGVCDGKTGDVTRLFFYPLTQEFAYPKETVKRIKQCKLQENIQVDVRNNKNLKAV